MSDYLSTENLTKIGERADAATKGPWYLAEDNGIIQSREVAVQVGPYSYEVVGIVPYEHVRPNDAEFIAAAREDVPALLAHIDALTEDRDKWEKVAISRRKERDEMAATIQRVRDLLIPSFYDRAEANQLLNKIQAALDAAGA